MSPVVFFAVAVVVAFLVGVIAGVLIQRAYSRSGNIDAGMERGSGEGVEMYVGNLAYNVNDKELKTAFAEHGSVLSARIIKNRMSGKSKGYGFVTMATKSGASAAVKAMNGAEFQGRKIVVSEARSKGRDE